MTPELLDWAELIFVMEPFHRSKLSLHYRPHLRNKRVVCLGIPDRFGFMDPLLVRLLELKVRPFLRR